MKPWIRKAHRWLGLIFSLTLLLSSGSGVIHTLMMRSQAPPPAARPATQLLDSSAIRLSVGESLARVPGNAAASAINLRMIAGQPHYQIFAATGIPCYVNAVTGACDPSMDEAYGAEIASGFLGGQAVRKADYLTAFNREYIGIFRILPVYRFDAADSRGTRVYVSTVTGSVTRLTDDGKQLEADIFTLFHKFGFIRNKDLRDWSLMLVTGATFAVSALGVVLFFLTRPRGRRN
ncbi:MAG: hypothetical protein RLZZ398_836 [Verrucomicrobiota bacterium]|jgi:hypothetical protein